MRTRLIIILSLLVPLSVWANPAILNPQSLIAFWIVAFWALVIESGVSTLAVSLSGVLVLPVFGTLLIANFATFAFGFMPLLGRLPLWLLEPLVVAFDALVMKLVVALPVFQRGDYLGVSWRRALLASALGNTASYFLGVLASQTPWLEHDTGAVGELL